MSERAREATGAAGRGDAGRDAKIRRNAWLLAGLAAFFYVAFIAWNLVRAPLGG